MLAGHGLAAGTHEEEPAQHPAFLVASSGQLKRVTDEQIIAIKGKEITLQAVPERSEFLWHWPCFSGRVKVRLLDAIYEAPEGASSSKVSR